MYRKILLIVGLVFAGLVAVPSGSNAAVQAVLHASPSGSGTACTTGSPCSLAEATEQLGDMTASMTGDLILELGGGTYQRTGPWELGPEHGGKNGHEVVIRAKSGATPRFSGGTTIAGWTEHDVLPSGKKIWKATVPSTLDTRQLYVGGRRAERASASADVLSISSQSDTGYAIGNPNVATWGSPGEIEFVYANAPFPWTHSRCGVASVTTTAVVMDQPCYDSARTGPPGVEKPSSVENAYELLAEPGQWYLDKAADKIYYIPRSNETMSTASVVAPVAESLLDVVGTTSNPVENLTVSGLTFEYSTWLRPSTAEGFVDVQANYVFTGERDDEDLVQEGMAPASVVFEHAEDVTFAHNTLRRMGSAGVSFGGGGSGNAIEDNLIEDVSGNGINIGDGAPRNTPVANLVVEDATRVANNVVRDVANEYEGGIGIFAGWVKNTTIEHNEVSNVPYTGISLGWGWGNPSPMVNNHILNNRVHNVMQSAARDGGAIYVNGAHASSPASTLKGNYVSENSQPSCSLYLDNGVSYWTVDSNVIDRASKFWVCIQNEAEPDAPNNTLTNNIAGPALEYRVRPPDGVGYGYPASTTESGNSVGVTSWSATAKRIIAQSGLDAGHVVGAASQVNLMRTATVSASTTVSPYTADAASDGKAETGWSSSATDTGAYWQADLGSFNSLSQIQILTRTGYDHPATRENLRIRVSPTSTTGSGGTVVCARGATELPYRGRLVCDLPTGTSGRYITVEKTDNAQFFLAEVRAFGSGSHRVDATAAASVVASTSASGYPVARVKDGDVRTSWRATGSVGAFAQFDLGIAVELAAIQVAPARDFDDPPSRVNFSVRVSNNANFADGSTFVCSQGSTPLGINDTLDCAVPSGTWRYMAVTTDNTSPFSLGEVAAWSALGAP